MAGKRFDVVATIIETRDGEEKKRYQKCGAAWEGPKGINIKLDAIPVGQGWSGWLALYEPKEKEQTAPAAKGNQDADVDLPF
jgi:hypothetical protein